MIQEDREMRSVSCGTRVFSSLAEQMVSAGHRCPHCADALRLMPAAVMVKHEFAYPSVQPVLRR